MSTFQVPATIEGVSTRKDGCLGVRLSTQELGSEQKVQLMDMAGKFGWFLFRASETAFADTDIPKEQPDGDEPKSPSQALRAAKFVWFTKKGGKAEDFPTWWRKWCNKHRQETIDAINEMENG